MHKYDIFLSHSSANKDLVRRISEGIQSEFTDGRNLIPWFDEADIPLGKSITGLVNEGLQQSRYFAIVMTPQYFNSVSGWTDAEWHAILFDDPDNRSGKIIPILAEDCPNLPPLLKHLKYVDIRGNHYAKGLDQLVKKIATPQKRQKTPGVSSSFNSISGSYIQQSEPDEINERLTSNLLPILQIPLKIYFGSIRADLLDISGDRKMLSKTELKELLYKIQLESNESKSPYMPAFRTYKDQIVTFYNLNDKDVLLNRIIERGTVNSENTMDLLGDEDKSRLIVSLLNMSISRHIFKCGLTQDREKQSRFYFPMDHGEINVIVWKSFKNQASRTVAKPIKEFDDYSLWLHQGASIKLIQLASSFYLQVIPTWVLTINGLTPAGGSDVAKIVNKWTNAERNLSVVRHIKFWTSILSKGKSQIEIYCGSSLIKINTLAAEIDMQVGINDDQILLMDAVEMTSIDDIIGGRLSQDIDQDMSELDDLTEEDEEDSYEEEEKE